MSGNPNNTPNLHIQTSLGSTRGPRPQGARRRGIAPGLFIANPDNSDEEGSGSSPRSGGDGRSSKSPSRESPVRASPITASSGSSGRGVPIPQPQAGSPLGPKSHALATIPAPQSSPLPSTPALMTPISHNHEPTPTKPYSEMHYRRAQTSPAEHYPIRPIPEARTSGPSSARDLPPVSPSRALPPLPSPPSKPPLPQRSSLSPSSQHPLPVPPPAYPMPPTPSNRPLPRMDSPESLLTPGTSDTARSFFTIGNTLAVNSESSLSTPSIGRPRSGSMVGAKIVVQVTMDNESFTTVDITGMQTAEGIKERVFSKLRFRDDEYPTLSLYRTDVDEQPDTHALTPTDLLHLCSTVGDSKATLKFFIMHTGVPETSYGSVVPPIQANFAYKATPSQSIDNRRYSKGSLSSASEAQHRGGTSASDWSEIGVEELAEYGAGSSQIQRATRRPVKSSVGRRLGSSTGSSRSPLTEHSNGIPSPIFPTPPSNQAPPLSLRRTSNTSSPSRASQFEQASPSPVYSDFRTNARKGSSTPTPAHGFPTPEPHFGLSSSAGPSRQPALGIHVPQDTYEGVDAETMALIAQLQMEQEEEDRTNVVQRRKQLLADEEYARKQQDEEKEEYHRMKAQETARRIERDRQIESDAMQAREYEEEEHRVQQERERNAPRADTHSRENSQSRLDLHDDRGQIVLRERLQRAQHYVNQAQLREGSFDPRNIPADGRATVQRFDRRPSDSHFDASRQHQYPSSNPLFDQPLYSSPPPQFSPEVPSAGFRRPSGFAGARYDEDRHASERLNDLHLRQIGLGARHGQTTGSIPRRPESRPSHPFFLPRENTSAPISGTIRPMDVSHSLPPAHVSRPPYQGMTSRPSVTPQPDQRGHYRGPSLEYAQDGRYPKSAPARVPPLQLRESNAGFVPFPAPHPRSASSSGSRNGTLPPQPYDRTSHSQASSPPHGSPQTATLPRRPTTLYDNSPPRTSHTNIDYAPTTSQHAWRPRAESASAAYRETFSPTPEDRHRASSSSAIADGEDTSLPYIDQLDESWLSVPIQPRVDSSDTASVAGTVRSGYSDATTIRAAQDADDDSGNTARGDELTRQLQVLIDARGGNSGAGTLRPTTSAPDEADEEEATLFWSTPATTSESPRPIRYTASPKPNLTVQTGLSTREEDHPTPSDSATESESETRALRAKSFARPKDHPEIWHVRPDPDQLIDNLDNYFPRIDLDEPIIDGVGSTPTTPASEYSPSRADNPTPPPPIHPSRLPQSPRTDDFKPLPPPQHPAVKEPSQGFGFNKINNRKSIRLMAENKRKTHQREIKVEEARDVFAIKQDVAKKFSPGRRLSMWGHRIQEVTATKINGGIPPTIPEAPLADGKPPTLTWVKGELIGKGSYGRVYIALNVTTGELMAVKQVELPATEQDRNDDRQKATIDSLRVEISLLKDLYHPNIVAYLGYETSIEHLSIFLEYVPGGTIASIYRTPHQARFEEQLVKFFTHQILQGLAYLHSLNIWHRDLKGDNILVDSAGVCKITDFGISKQTAAAYDSFQTATTMKGSVFWMAPEMIHAMQANEPGSTERTYSAKVDIWSLGCVVLEMWAGQRPWGTWETVAVIVAVWQRGLHPPYPTDMEFSDIAMDFMDVKCFARYAEDRPTALELMSHPFITDVDPKWTFSTSPIGKAVAKRGVKGMKA